MVTLTIQGNEHYCRQLGWVVTHSCTCECEGNRECRWCQGCGEYTYEELPFVLRFTRPVFDGIWTSIGLQANQANAGQVYGNRLLRAIHSLEPASVARAYADHKQDSSRRSGSKGRDENRGRDDLSYLAYIAIEACSREEMVVWEDDGAST